MPLQASIQRQTAKPRSSNTKTPGGVLNLAGQPRWDWMAGIQQMHHFLSIEMINKLARNVK
jgi:hypothetical protein